MKGEWTVEDDNQEEAHRPVHQMFLLNDDGSPRRITNYFQACAKKGCRPVYASTLYASKVDGHPVCAVHALEETGGLCSSCRRPVLDPNFSVESFRSFDEELDDYVADPLGSYYELDGEVLGAEEMESECLANPSNGLIVCVHCHGKQRAEFNANAALDRAVERALCAGPGAGFEA